MNEHELLGRARAGDENAFARLVEPHRGVLHAHCYRMLGSVADAEDALQETWLRAWRAWRASRGEAARARGSTRSRPTPACGRSSGGPSGCCRSTSPSRPTRTTAWAGRWSSRCGSSPIPTRRLGLEGGLAGPEARYDQRESVELAFIAALEYLPARQRAVLILRDVLGFSAREVAAALEMTPAGVNSALQRAHKAVDERLPERSQQAVYRSLDDQELRDDRRRVRRRLGARRRRRGRRDADRGRRR